MAGRTRPPAATKRTSAFTHAIVVWLRRKCCSNGSRAVRGELTQMPEPYSVWNGALLGCAGARMVLSTAGIVQQCSLNGTAVSSKCPAQCTAASRIVTTFRLGSRPKQGAESVAAGKLGAYPVDSRIVFHF